MTASLPCFFRPRAARGACWRQSAEAVDHSCRLQPECECLSRSPKIPRLVPFPRYDRNERLPLLQLSPNRPALGQEITRAQRREWLVPPGPLACPTVLLRRVRCRNWRHNRVTTITFLQRELPDT